MRKFFFTMMASVALFITNANAQQYKHAIGGRLGSANGISYKTQMSRGDMLELIANFRSQPGVDWFRLTGLYQKYNPISELDGLNWYYGAGASLGSYKIGANSGELYLGVNGVIGLDYKFDELPINLSLDWVPTFELTPSTGFWGGDFGLGIRYTF